MRHSPHFHRGEFQVPESRVWHQEVLDTETGRNKREKLRKVGKDVQRRWGASTWGALWLVAVSTVLQSHWWKVTRAFWRQGCTRWEGPSLKAITLVVTTIYALKTHKFPFFLLPDHLWRQILQDIKATFHVGYICNTVTFPRTSTDEEAKAYPCFLFRTLSHLHAPRGRHGLLTELWRIIAPTWNSPRMVHN